MQRSKRSIVWQLLYRILLCLNFIPSWKMPAMFSIFRMSKVIFSKLAERLIFAWKVSTRAGWIKFVRKKKIASFVKIVPFRILNFCRMFEKFVFHKSWMRRRFFIINFAQKFFRGWFCRKFSSIFCFPRIQHSAGPFTLLKGNNQRKL